MNDNKKFDKETIIPHKRTFNDILNTESTKNSNSTRINDVLFIRIVSSDTEFKEFINKTSSSNIENLNAFFPKFTNQIFGQDELLNGYKDLEILLALTPATLSPFFKINYKSKDIDSEDICKLFGDFFQDYFNQDEEVFLRNLETDLSLKSFKSISLSKGVVIDLVKEEIRNKNSAIRIFTISLPTELNLAFHTNLQRFATFFIDGASEIPISHGHWHYYIITEESVVDESNNESNVGRVKILGFSTIARFHMSIKTYRSMISQFLIVPNSQRSGFGFKLLDSIYRNELLSDSCVDISTEDPGDDYIYLRDAVLFSNTIEHFKARVKDITKVKTLDEFDKLTLSDQEVFGLSKSWKLSSQLVRRYEILLKYVIASDEPSLEEALFQDINAYLVSINKEVFTPKKGDIPSFIYFEDDEDFDCTEILNGEDQDMNKLAEDLQKFSDDLTEDFKKVKVKCLKILQNV